jgi:hypothetical protein
MHLIQHASSRAQHRSVSCAAMAVVLEFADIELPSEKGRRRLGLSARAVAEAFQAGIPAMVVEKASRTVLVVAPDDTVVTVLRGFFARRVRKTRRPSRVQGWQWCVR